MFLSPEELLQKDAFSHLSKDQISGLQTVLKKAQGKTPLEVMSLMLNFSETMSGGKKISKESQQAMMDVMLANMPTEQREKMQQMIKRMQ